MRRLLRISLAVAAALALAVAASAASLRTYDVPHELAEQVASVKTHSSVPVLLPDTLKSDLARLYADGGVHARSWALSLAAAPRCDDATACFVADFTARRGGRLDSGPRVRLRAGYRGFYRPISCGASCSPASISWRRKGVLYDIQFQPVRHPRASLIAMANQALKAGPR